MALVPTNFVDDACPNEHCPDYMIAKRYPTRLDHIPHGETIVYFSIAARCPQCGSFMPPHDGSVKQEPNNIFPSRDSEQYKNG